MHLSKFIYPKIPELVVKYSRTGCSFTSEIAKNEIPELAKKSDYCLSMSKTRQCLKTLNGGNLDTVQVFLGQDRIFEIGV